LPKLAKGKTVHFALSKCGRWRQGARANQNNIKLNPVFRGMPGEDSRGFNQRKIVLSIGVKELLDSGVHFGHQTKRWNPKMKPFIFDARNGIHIIDLSKTLSQLETACEFLGATVRKGGKVIFVGEGVRPILCGRALARRHLDEFQHHQVLHPAA
jgi:Ribosomal protein S2